MMSVLEYANDVNKTVAEIAEQTGVTRSTVIEILNDVSEAIKE